MSNGHKAVREVWVNRHGPIQPPEPVFHRAEDGTPVVWVGRAVPLEDGAPLRVCGVRGTLDSDVDGLGYVRKWYWAER